MIISIAKAANQQQNALNAVHKEVHKAVDPEVVEQEQKENMENDVNHDEIVIHPQHQNAKGKQQDKGYVPKAIYGILYPPRGFLEAHTDAHQGWVVSISVGADCDFWYQHDNDEKKNKVMIESGDVMVFPGYRLMHGVDAVGERVPRFWKLLQ